ncbi:MAG: glycosyltransferase family A protein [FCB group bacterium]|jgi:glycosyltransferase involved in cell wall biosynthesis
MEQRNQPFFSIIITAYNRANLLKRAINSLLTQTESDWEAVIVNDGSTDKTEVIARDFSSKYQNIKTFFQINHGAGFSKNFGISKSSGKYITFLDSDDEYKSEHLFLLKRYLINNPDIDFLHGTAEIIGNTNVPDFNNPGQIIHLDNCIIGGTFVFKKAILEKTNGYPILRFGDDVSFYNLVFNLNMKIAKVDFKTYIYHRDNDDSVCNIILKIER